MPKTAALILSLAFLAACVPVTASSDRTPGSTSETGARPDVVTCCHDYRGNCDGDPLDQIDISDLTALIDYLFFNFNEPVCFDEANVDAEGGVDIGDVMTLVSYLFFSSARPADCPFTIRIVDLKPGNTTVHGTATVPDVSAYKVVLWAKTDRWYIQPTTTAPFTTIQPQGTWSSWTHPWQRMLALLVDTTHQPGAVLDYHPSLDEGVVSWDEYPGKSIRNIFWSGYDWQVKSGTLLGPGPNYFSDDTANVAITANGELRLRIQQRGGIWYCAETILDQTLGYGVYSFKLNARVDSLDFNTIFAGFVYETIEQEFDMEFSQRLANPFNAQYVAQPWYIPGNIDFYNMPAAAQTSHSMEWRADRIVFRSWTGHATAPTQATLIHSWTYTGAHIPPPEVGWMRFNLYLYGGEAPVSGLGNEVTITSFSFSP